MGTDTESTVQPTAVARVGTQLPYHKDVTERTILGLTTLFDKLRCLETLEPDPINGRLFNQLFDLVTMSKMTTRQEEQVLADPRIQGIIPELRQIWGEAEYLLERAFARRVAAAGGPSTARGRAAWEAFPYLDQYRQLARMECNTLDTALGERRLPAVRTMAFLGSGPTPFSALCFRERLGAGVRIVNVDRSAEAVAHGRRVAEALGDRFCGNMSFVRAEVTTGGVLTPPASSSSGEDDDDDDDDDDDENDDGGGGGKNSGRAGRDAALLSDLGDCDVVHFAALMGETEQDKRDLLVAVARAMRPGALIMVRSTDSLRQLLYPKMDVDCWEVLSVLTPVLATRYFGGSTSLTTIVLSVDE